jgi:hypothetical protein
MSGFQLLLVVIAVNAGVLGFAFLALSQLDKSVRRCGR